MLYSLFIGIFHSIQFIQCILYFSPTGLVTPAKLQDQPHPAQGERKRNLRQSQFAFQPSPTLVGHRQTDTKESLH